MRASAVHPTIEEAVAVARGHVYGFLAAALADPLREHFGLALDRKLQAVAAAAAELLASEARENVELGTGELPPRQLDVLPVVTALARPREEIVVEHQDVFGLLLGKTAPPCETEYCRSTLTFYRSHQLADVAGFYQAFGLEPNREQPERQDHISVELEFMAHLIEKELAAAASSDAALEEKAPLCREAQIKFFEAHLAWWVPAFAELLRQAAPADGLYAALADALARFIPCERAVLGIRSSEALAEPRSAEETVEGKECSGCMPCQ